MKLIESLLCIVFVLFTANSLAQDLVIWSGGISEDERALAPSEGTKLVFFVSTGSYLSDITVVVSDSENRELVNTRTNGPWLYLDLDLGDYTVRASRENGSTQSATISVTGNNQEFGFMFPGD